MKPIKKVFNVEYDLTSEEFKLQKQDEISAKCQTKHKDFICKITTFCTKDKQMVIHTTQENVDFMGASSKLLAFRPLAEQSFLTMDDDMVKTYEIVITADTDLPDYVSALDIAQAKADEMFEADDSKMPLVTVVDYRWGNTPATLSASVFGDTDENGNTIPLINATAPTNVIGGNKENGKEVLENLKNGLTFEPNQEPIDTGITIKNLDYFKCEVKDIDLSQNQYFCGYANDKDANKMYFGTFDNKLYLGRGQKVETTVDFTKWVTIEMRVDRDSEKVLFFVNDEQIADESFYEDDTKTIYVGSRHHNETVPFAGYMRNIEFKSIN